MNFDGELNSGDDERIYNRTKKHTPYPSKNSPLKGNELYISEVNDET